jgi:hypothetical protein
VFTNRDEELTAILGAGIDSLDIPEDQYLVAEAAYKAASAFLRDYWVASDAGGAMYPQGSMRLGTVTRLIHRKDEYDLDMVCRHDRATSAISQSGLKADVGEALDQFVKAHPEYGLTLDAEGRRCWTFKHKSLPFHLDVLPALPDPAAAPNGILVTDTEAFRWHPSAPIDYAEWFLDRQHAEWRSGAKEIALRKNMDVEALPRRVYRTTLQRTVQALKRHRDIFFDKDLKNRPASVIITTLAARAYEPGGGNLFEVLSHVVAKMPELVERQIGAYVISNPVSPKENFADRWKGHPGRAKRFFEWMERAQLDFAAIGESDGVDAVITKAAAALGNDVALAAQRVFGEGLRTMRIENRMVMLPATGTLVTGTHKPVPQHVFHGE